MLTCVVYRLIIRPDAELKINNRMNGTQIHLRVALMNENESGSIVCRGAVMEL